MVLNLVIILSVITFSMVIGLIAARLQARKRTTTQHVMKKTDELQAYYHGLIHELAQDFDVTLSSGMEYELGFNRVMSMLNVPLKQRVAILWTSKHHAELNGFSYQKLSPLNQFLITALPYVWYCLINKPPAGLGKEKIDELINDEEFSEYIDRLSRKISQEVKGALWKPFHRP